MSGIPPPKCFQKKVEKTVERNPCTGEIITTTRTTLVPQPGTGAIPRRSGLVQPGTSRLQQPSTSGGQPCPAAQPTRSLQPPSSTGAVPRQSALRPPSTSAPRGAAPCSAPCAPKQTLLKPPSSSIKTSTPNEPGPCSAPCAKAPPKESAMPPPKSFLKPPSSAGAVPTARSIQPPTTLTQRPAASGLRPPSSTSSAAGVSRLKPPTSGLPPPCGGPCSGAAEQKPKSQSMVQAAAAPPPPPKGKITMKLKSSIRKEPAKEPPPPTYAKKKPLARTIPPKRTVSGTLQASTSRTEEIAEKTIIQPSILKKIVTKQEGLSSQMAGAEATSPTRTVDAYKELLTKTSKSPSQKQIAKRSNVQVVPVPIIITSEGEEPVIQQSVVDEIVRRTSQGEHVTRHLTAIDVDEATGEARQVELDYQQLDPHYAIPEGSPSEVITVQSQLAVSQTYQQTSKKVTREIIGDPAQLSEAAGGPALNPVQLARLVEEEQEDVEETLKMVPPDLEIVPEKIALTSRLHNLRLTAESIAVLQESVVPPATTGDEAQGDVAPETIASIMHTVECGITPQASPPRIFNTLFSESSNNEFITMSSVSPGPMQDVVVPNQLPDNIHEETVSDDFQKLSDYIDQNAPTPEFPQIDIFTRIIAEDNQKAQRKNKRISFRPVGEELPPWSNADLEPAVNLVGAEPVDALEALDAEESERSGELARELANGIEYFVHQDPLQYMSRVQLRGSVVPRWFPGYMIALPEFPGVVKLAKSPSEIFFLAWKAVQPKLIPEDDNICF